MDTTFIVCEPLLTEACFLVERRGTPPARVLDRVVQGVMRIGLRLDEEMTVVRALMECYANVPMSLADACLVRLAEITGLPICTLDSDFAIYRASGRRALTLITPERRSLHEA